MFDIDEVMERRMKQFDSIEERSRMLFAFKNRQYNDTIRLTGVLGASVELVGIAGRLMALVLKNPLHGKDIDTEVLTNTFIDALVYARIGLMMLEDKNWDGE